MIVVGICDPNIWNFGNIIAYNEKRPNQNVTYLNVEKQPIKVMDSVTIIKSVKWACNPFKCEKTGQVPKQNLRDEGNLNSKLIPLILHSLDSP